MTHVVSLRTHLTQLSPRLLVWEPHAQDPARIERALIWAQQRMDAAAALLESELRRARRSGQDVLCADSRAVVVLPTSFEGRPRAPGDPEASAEGERLIRTERRWHHAAVRRNRIEALLLLALDQVLRSRGGAGVQEVRLNGRSYWLRRRAFSHPEASAAFLSLWLDPLCPSAPPPDPIEFPSAGERFV